MAKRRKRFVSRLYNAYRNVLKRCLNSNHPEYPRYGGRGIKICSRWLQSFQNFANDIGPPPDKHSLDRIDVNGHYSCGLCEDCKSNKWMMNCKWSTYKEQNRNMRKNIWITYNGQTLCATDWSILLGIKLYSIYQRWHDGWPEDKVLSQENYKNNPIVKTFKNQRNIQELENVTRTS